ncbi:MAG: arylesterase [Acidobacteriaceae bacterium]
MKPLFAAIFIGLLLSLSGCKQKQSAANTAPVSADTATATATDTPASTAENSAASQKTDTRPVIVCFGDSLTAGYGTDPGQSYPDYLQQDLDKLGYHYHVVNAGISGNTTKDGVDRLKDVLDLKPVVVIVAFGGNDGLRGLPISDTRANLDQIVETLRKAGVKVVLGGITLPPNYGADYIREFNQTYQFLAKKYKAPLMPFILKGVFGVPGSMQQDDMHATAQGNQQVARNLLPFVKQFLKK